MATPHRFGGTWSDDKIDRLRRYLAAYVNVLKGKGLTTFYIDAFAGTGYRNVTKPHRETVSLEFDDFEVEQYKKGSVIVALETEPAFDHFIFVESSRRKHAALTELVARFPHLGSRVDIRQSDANAFLQDWCPQMAPKDRAVLFLDPYGMQVEWKTLEAIAATKKIDLWLLFPLGTGVVRLLTRDAPPPEDWGSALTRTFGTDRWQAEFYAPSATPSLFEAEEQEARIADFSQVGEFFVSRLRTIFTQVSETTRVYRNSRSSPLYMLCFAAGNPKGAPTAVRIAKYILEKEQWRTDPRLNGPTQRGTP